MRRIVFVVASTVIAATGLAQPTPPFFGGGVIAFDPEPAIISSGVVLDTQATVSDDRKYATIGARTAQTKVQALTRFPVVQIQSLGFVGGVNLGDTPANFSAAQSPDQIDRAAKSWIFSRAGMYLVTPLK